MDSKETIAASEKASGAAACGRYAATICSALARIPQDLPDSFDVFVGDREAYCALPDEVKENDAQLRALIRKANNSGYKVIVWHSERELRTYYSFSKLNTGADTRAAK